MGYCLRTAYIGTMEGRCAAPFCAAESALWAKGVPLCLRHYDRVDRELRARGTTLAEFDGSVLELVFHGTALLAASTALADEGGLLRRLSAIAQQRLKCII